jgi:hypothetical protein
MAKKTNSPVDVGVGELRGSAGLAQESFSERGLHRIGRWHDLEGDRSVERNLVRQVDHTHSPSPDLSLKRVSTEDRLLKGHELSGGLVAH